MALDGVSYSYSAFCATKSNPPSSWTDDLCLWYRLHCAERLLLTVLARLRRDQQHQQPLLVGFVGTFGPVALEHVRLLCTSLWAVWYTYSHCQQPMDWLSGKHMLHTFRNGKS